MSASQQVPAIVRKAGEGYDRPNAEEQLPLDINYQKLSEWLVSRQKLPADWHKRLQAIQAKVAEAAKELPPGLLAGLPGSAPDAAIDYFRAVQIRDQLAAGGERTLFGGLGGQAGVWDKIVKAYENGGVFIGEAAGSLVQNVDYEVPFLRKAMAKCSSGMADADRRHAEYVRAAAAAAANYKKECEKLGISGAAVGPELRRLAVQLPSLFEQLVDQLRDRQLDDAIAYYREFTHYAHGPGAGKGDAQQQQQPEQQQQQQQGEELLPVLMEVREQRTQPCALPPAPGGGDANNAAAGGGGIDWGDGGGGVAVDWGGSADGAAGAAGGGGGVSWDLGDVCVGGGVDSSSAAGGGGISWDVAVEPADADAAGSSSAGAAAGGGPSLDWDFDLSGIGVEESGTSGSAAPAPGGIDWGIEAAPQDAAAPGSAAAAAGAAGAGANGAAASGGGDASAARLQHDSDYRARLVDDLQELRAFLLSRKGGLASSGSSADMLRALAPGRVAETDAGDVAAMLARVESLLAALHDERLRQLLMISSSSRYVERLSSSLQRKAGQEAKMLAAAAETQARKHESRATLVSLQPKLAEVVERTRAIKAAVEAALAKQFGGRRVNVLGEINNVLAAGAAA